MAPTPTTSIRRRLVALAVASTLVLATAAVVTGDEILDDPAAPSVPVGAVTQDEDELGEEELEDELEDAQDQLEDEQERLEDELERQQEALEDEADDCVLLEEGTHGWKVCHAAQAWKSQPTMTTPGSDQGEFVSSVARDNHGAQVAEQKAANGGLPDAARDALSKAGPNGDGPPNGAGPGSGDEEEEDEEEEDEEEEDEEEEDEDEDE
jgi:hypothetical protein